MTNLTKSLLLVFTASIISCNSDECKNNNPVFDANLPGTQAYNEELLKQINSKPEVTYWFEKYEEKEGKEYIYVDIQGDSLCAKGILTLANPGKELDKLREVKGKGYGGSELDNLQFIVDKDAAKTEFIYKSADAIIE